MHTAVTGGEVSFQLDVARRLVRCTLHGAVSPQQMISAIRAAHSDPDFSPDFDAIVDFREFSGEWSSSDLQEIAMNARESGAKPGARRAVLVSQNWQYDLIRRLQAATLLSPVVYRPFQSLEAAENWIRERQL